MRSLQHPVSPFALVSFLSNDGGLPFFFDVYSSGSTPQVPQGGSATFTFSGHDAPAAGLTWDIVQGGTTIATSSAANLWLATPNSVTAPEFAPAGTYEARCKVGGSQYFSSYFQVYLVDYNPKTGTRYLIDPNGAQVSVTAHAVPTAANPTVNCVLPAGYPMIVTWNYLTGSTSGYYIIIGADRKQMITTSVAKVVGSGTAILFLIGQIIDQSGNAINFNYGATGTGGFPMLASITDKNGASLVTFTRTSGTGNLTAINDRYSRSVYYTVGAFSTANVPYGYTQSYQEVSQVSQIVTTGTTSPPSRYVYGYQDVPNGEGSEQVPFLHTITVPSPTGTGNATSTINYATNGTCYVTSTVDANGNSHIYTATNASTTLVTIEDVHGTVDYSYSVTFDSNMSETGKTNGSGVYQTQRIFGDPNDPFRASEITNANGNTSYATWDQFGNCLTSTSARGTVTVFTYSYASFAIGEVTKVAEGAKTPTSMTYYEPSGLLQNLNVPAPGTASNGATAVYSWTYDQLGNVLTETGPGNAVTSSITSTMNYTTDGGYNQSAAIRQPLTRTDNLGHVTHMRYDGQANLLNATDSLGNETQVSYNLANQSVTTTFPATGSSGPGNASYSSSYLYAGGPKEAESQNNESGVLVWQIAYTLGAEGEELARAGSTQPYLAVYDALYRPTSVSDGNSHATQTFYSTAGYAWKTVYPNGDTFEYTSFDNLGDPLQRVDGRGVVTNYLYTDPESKLTNVQYPSSTSLNVAVSYDAYGRTAGVIDGSGTHAYVLDDRDNMLTDTTTYTGMSAMILTSHYNPDGTRSVLILPDGTSCSYQFDAAARATGLTGPGGQSWSWSYLNNNWISQQNAGGQVVSTWTRNARGSTTDFNSTLNNQAQTLLSDYQVSYAANLTLGSVTTNMPSAPSTFSGTTSYTHDSKDELTNETSSRGGGYNFTSAFDGAGNPTTFKGGSHAFNSANQNTANTYDGNGNPTSYNGNALTFDAENRMTSYGSAIAAGYRADGLRAWKQNSSGTTYYIYDGDKLVEEVNSSGATISDMTWGPNGLLARTTSTRTLLYSTDALGQMAQQVNASTGAVVASYLFDAWGARQVSTNDPTAGSDPFSGYNTTTGYYTDWETGLELLGHRYYDPTAGRFLNRDPIGMAGGVNVYEYASNGPTAASDPSGLIGLGDIIGGSISIIFKKCPISVAFDLIRLIGGGAATGCVSLPNAICKALGNCLGAVLAAILVNATPVAEIPVVGECVTGLLSSIIGQSMSWICDKMFPTCSDPNSQDNMWCHVIGAVAAGIAGCMGSFGDGGDDSTGAIHDVVIGIVGSLAGNAGITACKYRNSINPLAQ